MSTSHFLWGVSFTPSTTDFSLCTFLYKLRLHLFFGTILRWPNEEEPVSGRALGTSCRDCIRASSDSSTTRQDSRPSTTSTVDTTSGTCVTTSTTMTCTTTNERRVSHHPWRPFCTTLCYLSNLLTMSNDHRSPSVESREQRVRKWDSLIWTWRTWVRLCRPSTTRTTSALSSPSP